MLHPSVFAISATALVALSSGCSSAQADPGSQWSASTYYGGSEQVTGSGVAASEARAVGRFDSIRTDSAVDIVVRQGPRRDVIVQADDNLLGNVTLDVDADGTLVVSSTGSYRSRIGLRAIVTVPELTGAAVRGSGDITFEEWDARSLALAIAGSGDIRLRGSLDRVDASVAGSGDIDLTNARVGDAHASVAGSGDIRLPSLDTLYGSVNGTGDIRAGDVDRAFGSVAGTGEISYASARSATGTFGR